MQKNKTDQASKTEEMQKKLITYVQRGPAQ